MSLGVLFVATQLVDIIWGPLLLIGVERVVIAPGITQATPLDFVHYPYTHSLAAFVGWSLITYLAARFIPFRSSLDKNRAALLLCFAVFSHFLLDWITHRPDIPLFGDDSFKLGLGLWNHVWLSFALEVAMLVGGVWLYMRSTQAVDRIGRWGILILAAFLVALNMINFWGAPPPDYETIGWGAMISFPLLALIAYWLDEHRIGRSS